MKFSKLNISNDVNLGVMLFSGQAETNNKFDKNKLDYLFPLNNLNQESIL